MEETVNQVIEEPVNRTFTQAEVDAIVSDRLKRDRTKYADYDALKEKAAAYDAAQEAQKMELEKVTERASALQAELDSIKQKNEVRDLRERISTETGVPARLLNAETEEEMREQAKVALEYMTPTYPAVKDAGEVTHPIGKRTTRDQFADWANKAFNN